ncbi:MAG: hypothetical protein HQL01_13920 [Nitrospirae bacterium]|nr:hypothetical protein [Nitrospirota bacterium]
MKTVMGRVSALILTVSSVILIALIIEEILDLYEPGGYKLTSGIAGTLMIILSFMYSARRRRIAIKTGSIKKWLLTHEWLSLIGSVIIFVHTGRHFHAALPVVALVLLFIALISGLTGKYVYDSARKEVNQKKAELRNAGFSEIEIEENLSILAVASETLLRWRDFHMPLVTALLVMVLYHIISVMYFRGF